MTINSAPLRKILELEDRKGFNDSAVIGGLDRFLHLWADQTGRSISDSGLLKRFNALCVSQTGYAQMTGLQRRQWAKKVLSLLDEVERNDNPKKLPRIPVKTSSGKVSPARKTGRRLPKTAGLAANTSGLEAPVTAVKGISGALQKKFNKLGINTVRDLLYFFPHRHIDYSQRHFISQLTPGEEHTIIANVWEAHEVRLGLRRGAEAIVGDETGNMRIVWFNQPYMAKNLKTGSRIVVSGKVTLFNGRPQFESPEWEPVEEDKDRIHTGRLVPVYSLTEGLGQRQVRRIMKSVVDLWSGNLIDFLPTELRQKLDLMDLPEAISQSHFPESTPGKDKARTRLAFDELFLLQLGVLNKKRHWQESNPGTPFRIDNGVLDAFLKSLPYTLTVAQSRVLNEILKDLEKPRPMSRLLQGEVGSGKTIIAAAALLVAASNGFQSAFMAPTEILAEQHFNSLRKLLAQVGTEEGDGCIFCYRGFLSGPLTIALLIGDINHLKKQGVHERIRDGGIDIVIGTHALIQKDVNFLCLGLAVVDEQHRFGVAQRSGLRQKGANPHILVMTATPIPRTLALTLYGDLDLSVIDQLPPGRQIIKTKWLRQDQRESAYAFLRRQVNDGLQAFIICPLVEESEVIQAKAAVAEYEYLSHQVFPDLRLGLLHGRMSSQEKDEVMQCFHRGELQALVSTPVIEVGIDVPNATVMLIESADRFGLSQLHQFRGRVGRGTEQSYCLLLAENPSDIGKKRLDLIEKVQNGFVLAEEDLKLRGPGEFFGTRQSGLPDLKMARLSDIPLLEMARNEATNLFQHDPGLKGPDYQLLAKELVRVWKQQINAEWS